MAGLIKSHRVAEHKPVIRKLLPAARSDSETGVYERPVQSLRTHSMTLVASSVRRCGLGRNIWSCWQTVSS